MKKSWIWIVALFALLIIFFVVYSLIKHFTPVVESVCVNGPDYVSRVIDGDTFELCSGETVRLLCVNTPEKREEGYEDAKIFLEDLILYKQVSLSLSNYGGNNTDKYSRLLRWVYVENESSDTGELILVNKYLLEEGYGDILIIPPETCNEVAD